ncbi:hypothetical protein BV20DRAFT_1057761 [Pilatotrama ljubarskyi]|nr:hypothetical protein BV20DRAFT_1057761 [Pilatotrama ljubarskyi]
MNPVHKDDPSCLFAPIIFSQRDQGGEIGRMEYARDYWGTGAYLLMVKSDQGDSGPIPYWMQFGIDERRANARPSCKRPGWDQLREDVGKGHRLRLCCGKLEGLPKCCYGGGWTHELARNGA